MVLSLLKNIIGFFPLSSTKLSGSFIFLDHQDIKMCRLYCFFMCKWHMVIRFDHCFGRTAILPRKHDDLNDRKV